MTHSAEDRRVLLASQPPYLHPPYVSSKKRAPARPLVALPSALASFKGPVFGQDSLQPGDCDLTKQHSGEPLGERIIVIGKVTDDDGHPVRGALIEIWQANAAGRYKHKNDSHAAPLDPNFSGCGRVITDNEGRYSFVSIKPGAYPWRNHENAWRPAHIHFSLFGAGILSRLVTQMYFPNDPLLPFDPIYNSIPDESARQRLVSQFDWATTQPEHALGYRFDVILRGNRSTPMENTRP
ncbi:MAG: protocatechuate 3,4-dioxygenase subunit beta [Acidobacteria bacterium]|nr:protocatechuate 3,4-dioxygenase subunit beta [Acidobacteriota bacterium]MBS1867053.1 protocatechuate 3,4-dioxygenase subunit beta [Acidobacteriota bacterium]